MDITNQGLWFSGQIIEINNKTSKIYAKINENLIKNSYNWNNFTNLGVFTVDKEVLIMNSNTIGNTINPYYLSLPLDDNIKELIKNQKLTFSCEYAIDEALEFGTTNPWVGFELGIQRNTTTGGSSQFLDWFGGKSMPTDITNGWQYRSFTTSMVSDFDIAAIGVNFYMRDVKGIIRLRKPKIELGSISTPWCPNSADYNGIAPSSENSVLSANNFYEI